MKIRAFDAFWVAFAVILGGRFGWQVVEWIKQFTIWLFDQPY
jgi:hypothetical protein